MGCYLKILILCFFVITSLLVISCDKKTTEPKPIIANPVMTPAGNMYSETKTVTVTCLTAGAEIHYTLNGNEPTESSDLYTGSIEISVHKTIKAKAFLDGYTPSGTVTQVYEIYTTVPKEMIFVEGETFQMDGGTYYNAFPAHTVTLSSLYISKYKETQKEWRSIMSNDYFNEEDGLGDNNPAYGLTWYQALYYCNKKSIIEGLTPCYSKNGVTDPRNWGYIPTTNFSFFQNNEWLWDYSFINSQNDFKIHILNCINLTEYTISDSVGMGPPCFDYDNIVYHNRSNGNASFSLIKYNLLTNEKNFILKGNSKFNVLFLTYDKQLLVYYVNSVLYTYNTLSREVRQIYSFSGGYQYLFSHMMLHPLERKIFFIEGRSLKMLDLNSCQITVFRQGNVDFASLSPDGSKIYFVTNTKVAI